MGTLLPENTEDLIVAEKSISVSNLINGTTRLQPVVMQIGQAAGIIAGLAIRNNTPVSEVPVREVQQTLLDAKGYLLPYLDVPVTDPAFQALQKAGVTGILRGRGMNVGWENQTWIDADSALISKELLPGLTDFFPTFSGLIEEEIITVDKALRIIYELKGTEGGSSVESFIDLQSNAWEMTGLDHFDPERPVTRKEFAVLLDTYVDPFGSVNINIYGERANHGKQ